MPPESENKGLPEVHGRPVVPCSYSLNLDGLKTSLKNQGRHPDSIASFYELSLRARGLSLNDSVENLIALPTLKDFTPFWYQQETVKKVIRSFRGRALLADEVGLGKTIEACLILKEYKMRGLVGNALILTPSPLVSQWKEELKSKFDLDMKTTDDFDFQAGSEDFWQSPWIIASLSTAKSKKNFDLVARREFDLVIVDEAHHLKNRESLSWKLVNALKKRFLLFLTATPVENNLMEIYNLITLLKAGQLKTPLLFQKEFIDRKDPLRPKNHQLLKETLREVMIRNTRAVANIHLPPRHAETLIITPTPLESECYERITMLVRQMRTVGNGVTAGQLWLNTLLAQAGSSLATLRKTVSGMKERGTWPKDFAGEADAIIDLCQRQQCDLRPSSKIDALLKLLKSPEKKIVFVKYHETLNHIRQALLNHKIPHALFHGQMGNAERDAQIASFAGDIPVLLSTESGGEGKNLQFCHTLINFDLPWNPMKIEQRIGRLHRIGQTHEVFIYNLCARGSLEDYLLDLLDRKINMFEMVVGEVEMILGKLDEEKEFDDIVFDIWSRNPDNEQARMEFEKFGLDLLKAKEDYAKTKQWNNTVLEEDYQL